MVRLGQGWPCGAPTCDVDIWRLPQGCGPATARARVLELQQRLPPTSSAVERRGQSQFGDVFYLTQYTQKVTFNR